MIHDWWYSFIYWVEDNVQYVVAGLILALFIGIMVFIRVGEGVEGNPLVEGVKKDTIEEVEAMKEVTGNVDDVFSLLGERRVGTHEEFPAYEIDIFLKKPFIHEADFKDALKEYIEIYKWKENYKLSGLKIRVYDRKQVYDENLLPRASVYYFEEIDPEQLLTEEEGGERLYGDDVMADNFLETIEAGEKPSYGNYDIRIDGFKDLELNKSIVPLTDQEFAFYLKMEMYQTILGGSKYGGAKLYLQWDLGKDVYKDGIVAIEREFENFNKRHLDIGGQHGYYENEYILKQQLAVEKPQFLLFALTNNVVDDPLDAQRELIKEDPELFKDVLEENIEEQVQDLVDDEDDEDEEEEEVIDIEDDDGGYEDFSVDGG